MISQTKVSISRTPIRSMCNVFLMLGLLLSIQVPYGEDIFIWNPEMSIKGKPPNGSVAG